MSRKWLITGVSSGFGNEMTKQLLEKGDTVIATVKEYEKGRGAYHKVPGDFRLSDFGRDRHRKNPYIYPGDVRKAWQD